MGDHFVALVGRKRHFPLQLRFRRHDCSNDVVGNAIQMPEVRRSAAVIKIVVHYVAMIGAERSIGKSGTNRLDARLLPMQSESFLIVWGPRLGASRKWLHDFDRESVGIQNELDNPASAR